MIDVVRPVEAPASLAAAKSYSGHDVRTALHATFLCKCYLCETPVELGTFTVDHRRPKGDPRFAGEKHAWTNLFPACSRFRCNERRERTYPDGGLLDPGDGVEQRVVQEIVRAVSLSLRQAGSSALVFRARGAGDVAAENTARELDRIHNGTDSTATDTASSLRSAIVEHVSAIAPDIHDYALLAASPEADVAVLAELRDRVGRLVSRRAPYSMLVRSYFASIAAVRALYD